MCRVANAQSVAVGIARTGLTKNKQSALIFYNLKHMDVRPILTRGTGVTTLVCSLRDNVLGMTPVHESN